MFKILSTIKFKKQKKNCQKRKHSKAKDRKQKNVESKGMSGLFLHLTCLRCLQDLYYAEWSVIYFFSFLKLMSCGAK